MSTKLNERAYRQLVADDLAFLDACSDTLEAHHIREILKDTIRFYYPRLAAELGRPSDITARVRAFLRDLPAEVDVTVNGESLRRLLVDCVGAGTVEGFLSPPGHRFTEDQIRELRQAVTDGAGHECDEWWNEDGACLLCDRKRS